MSAEFNGFELLYARLSAHIQRKLRNGEATERGLARLTGVSQPHLHQVLKGAKYFSPEMADQVMERLQIDVWALLAEDAEGGWETAPLLEETLGPGRRFPDMHKWRGRMPFPRSDLGPVERPVAVRLAEDPDARHLFRAGDVALLEPLRLKPASGYCAIDLRESGLIRWVDRLGDRLVLRAKPGGAEMEDIGVEARARVVWIGRRLGKEVQEP